MINPILVGAVLYEPKVAVIWEIIQEFFEDNHCPVDMVFYTNYTLQVSALLDKHIDIAWNSPLAWLDAQRRSRNTCRAIAMRDTDQDRVSHWVVKSDGPIQQLGDLRGCTVATGALDSPQARLIPLGFLARNGLDPLKDFQVKRFDVLVGKHGDHIGGEKDAFDSLARGETEATAMLDLNWKAWTEDGTINPDQYRILATTDPYDHCVFTVRDDFSKTDEVAWLRVLHGMSYEIPKHREMMDLEGLKAWKPGRTTGFACLSEAVNLLKFFGT